MSRTRLIVILAGLFGLGIALGLWAADESRRQRNDIEAALRTDVTILAQSLGPALAAASASALELDEIVGWKLLDNARLLARLDAADALPDDDLDRLIELNGLDSVIVLDHRGVEVRRGGPEVPAEILGGDVLELVSGRASDAVLNWSLEEGPGHVAVAAARPGGGAVVVTTHASTAFAFARRLGVANLLERTVGSGSVLYLAFHEEPGERDFEASWDDEPVPVAAEHDGTIRDVRGKAVLEVAVAVAAPAGRQASLRVGLDAAPLERATSAAFRRSLVVGLILLALGFAGTAITMVARARAMERTESLRRLADLDDRRRKAERLAAAGALAAGVAHEIRNPLNAISLAAQRLERRPGMEDDCRRFATSIREEVRRLEDILRGFLDLARPSSAAREPVGLRAVATEVLELLRIEASGRSVSLEMEGGGETVEISADREAVRRAVLNLVRNAFEASPEGGRVTVLVEQDGKFARVRVRDDGTGFESDQAEQMFDAFFTTRADGTGLGLPMVRRVAVDHGGWARLDSRPAGGTEAILELGLNGQGSADDEA